MDKITNCPDGATNIRELEILIYHGNHDINLSDFTNRLVMSGNPGAWDSDWNWEDIISEVDLGKLDAQIIDNMIHAGLK